MKKTEQAAINKAVLAQKEKCYFELSKKFIDSKFWKVKNTAIYETENYYILKHYETFIACIEKDSKNGYDFLRTQQFKMKTYYGTITSNYSNTSARAISKFFKEKNASKTYRYYPI